MLWNNVVEALEECVQSVGGRNETPCHDQEQNDYACIYSLLSDGAAHLELAHQLHILELVLLGDGGVASVWLEITDLGDTELLHLRGEGELVAQRGDVVLHEIVESLVELVVLRLHVRVLHLFAQDVLVEGPGEVAL